MGNVLAVLKRDFIRLIKAPAALVVVGALLVLPSLYTWYNVLGFWDPYNNTGNMRVAVVNEDKGGSSDLTGALNVGASIEDALRENDQLNWQFVEYDDAMADLEAGRDYAVFVIPEDFTEKLLTVTTGDFDQPKLQYYVNMKTGPVAPKVTDTGSTSLEETINATFVATVTDAVVRVVDDALGEAKTAMAQGKSKATEEIDGALAAVSNARATLANVEGKLQSARAAKEAALAAMDEAKGALEDTSGTLGDVLSETQKVEDVLVALTPQAMEAVSQATAALSLLQGVAADKGYAQQLDEAIASLEQLSTQLVATALPKVTDELGNLNAASAQLGAVAQNQKVLIGQAKGIFEQIDQVLATASESISQADTLLGGVEADLGALRADIITLAESSALSMLAEGGTLDADAIAEFMGSPTTVVTEKLYSLNAYGSAMAPLFMNLTFWIGAFMLLVIMRQEVDAEGVKNLTVTQRYLSRFIMFGLFVVIQAVICCTGVLALGVEAASPPALFFAAALSSLAYLSIIYALSVTLLHVGKGLCIILVFMQIPAATGLYPIEMTAPFYQAISPFFPFTYGIGAMREAICGFYGADYFHDIGMLLVFFAVFMALGIGVRPYLANVNRTFAKQLAQSDIYNSQDIEAPARRFHMQQITRVLSDKEEYRQQMLKGYGTFMRRYPLLLRGALVVGIAVPLITGVMVHMSVGAKVVVLSLWLASLVLLLVFLSVVENARENFESQLDLGAMEEKDLQGLFVLSRFGNRPPDYAEEAAEEGETHE